MSVNEVKLKKAPIEFEIQGGGGKGGPGSRRETDVGSRTFAIGNEDHTIGNALRHILIKDNRVAFAGYSVPHPSEPIVHIRVQTASRKINDDDESAPRQLPAIEALYDSCQTLKSQCDIFLEKLEDKFPEVREDRIRMEEYAKEEEERLREEEEEEDEEEMEEDDGVEYMDEL